MRRTRGRLQPLTGAALASMIGIHLVVSIAVGAGIGYLLDRWLHTTPWFLVVFFMIGAIAGFRDMIRTVSQVSEDEDSGERP